MTTDLNWQRILKREKNDGIKVIDAEEREPDKTLEENVNKNAQDQPLSRSQAK